MITVESFRDARYARPRFRLRYSVRQSWLLDGYTCGSYKLRRVAQECADEMNRLALKRNPALSALRHHVTGAIERGEAVAVVGEPLTAVVFRVWPGGDVLALFPYVEDTPGHCSSFEHVGQHGGADYVGCVRKTRPATPEEYAPLMRELEAAPYRYRLRVIKRRGTK